MPFHLRLSHKINSIAAVGIAGVLALGALFLIGNASQEAARLEDERARTLGDSNSRLQITMLEQRRAEKNFMIRKDEKYVGLYNEYGKTSSTILADMIRQTEAAGQSELTRNLKIIQAGYQDYDRHFLDLAAAQTKLGLKEDVGLEGSLRKSVHEIESALGKLDDPKLTMTILMMRRHEKDFMLRRNPKYADDIKKRTAEFATQLAASDLPPSTKADLGQKLAAYQRDFLAWVDGAMSMAQNEQAMITSFRAVEPVIESVGRTIQQSSEQAKAAAAAARDATMQRMQISIVLIILAVSLLGLLIGRSVSRPLKGLTGGLKELGAGNFDVVLPGLDRHDEIGDMAQAVESCKVMAQEKARQKPKPRRSRTASPPSNASATCTSSPISSRTRSARSSRRCRRPRPNSKPRRRR